MTVPLFHVFIERARSTAPGAAAELARAIAARYGIPAAELEKRFAMGRFRVKGNVDRATADSYVADLASLGAVCTIVAANASATPSAGVATPPPVMTLPAQHRVPAPPPRAPAPPSAPPSFADPLGALSGEMPLTLSTLDGASEDEARSSRKIALPAQAARDAALPASFGPPSDGSDPGRDPGRGSSRKIATPAPVEIVDSATFDPFAPPEMQSESQELSLAVERKPRVSHPPPTEPEPTMAEPPRAGRAATLPPEPRASRSASVPVAASAARAPASAAGPRGLRHEGTRFIAGVVLAVVLGAVPALLIGAARESSAFATLREGLSRTQDEADTPEEWERLDRTRASVLGRMKDERQSIVITSLLMWAVISGGVAWLWFRAIDWERRLR